LRVVVGLAILTSTHHAQSFHGRHLDQDDRISSRTNNNNSDFVFRCADYEHAIPLMLPESRNNNKDGVGENENFNASNTLLDFIQADVNCPESLAIKVPPVGDLPFNISRNVSITSLINNSMTWEQSFPSTTITTTTTTTSIIRRRRHSNAAAFAVPQRIHFHFYAISSDLEMRFRCHPPDIVLPVLGPLPPLLVPTFTVYNNAVQEAANANNNNNNPAAPQSLNVNNEEDASTTPSSYNNDYYYYGITFVYNSSSSSSGGIGGVPPMMNTTHASIELWIPTPLFQDTVLLGPAFDHAWSVDLTMNPFSTTSTSTATRTPPPPPPMDVLIANGGAGTDFVLNTTTASNVLYYDETLDGTFQIHQVAAAVAQEKEEEEEKEDTTTTTIMNITTWGSNTLGTIVKEAAPSSDDDASYVSSITNIQLGGFQQKITTVGVLEEEEEDDADSKDIISVNGLAIDVFTTADCENNVRGFSTSWQVESQIILEEYDLDIIDPEDIAARRRRHDNQCYQLDMELFRGLQVIPGFPQSVNTTAFYELVVANGPAANTTTLQWDFNATNSDNDNNNNETSSSTDNNNETTTNTSDDDARSSNNSFDDLIPLPPYVTSLPCLSTTEEKWAQCMASGANAIMMTAGSVWHVAMVTMVTAIVTWTLG
jgi:hypothetical protein